MTELQKLYNNWINGKASSSEHAEFLRLLALPENREEAMQLLVNAIEINELAAPQDLVLSPHKLDLMLQSIVADAESEEPNRKKEPIRRIRFLRSAWLRYAAAIIILFGAGTYLWWHGTDSLPRHSSVHPAASSGNSMNVLPGGNKALLTLADGSTIVLDSAANGTLANQGNTTILKLKTGALAYTGNASSPLSASGEPLYNTISTPKGGQYQVMLPDGSKVWLNAASSIKFPTAFSGTDRSVEIKGEAYFEIAGDKSSPFMVKVASITVQVLGTSFNINAYKDEPALRTTLVDGSVKVTGDNNSLLLIPGEQAVVVPKAGPMQKRKAGSEMESILAWKNGLFQFNNTDLMMVLRQIARWYNVEVEYRNPAAAARMHFTGKLYRDVPLQDLIKGFNESDIPVKWDGQKIVVN